MAQLVLLVLAGITGFVGYNEAAKIEKRFRRGPSGIPALVWGVVCFFIAGLIGALLASEVVIGVLIGFVGYNEAAKYERQYGEGPLGIPPLVCGVVCSCLGLIGALTASTFVVWALVGFVGYNEAARYERQYSKGPLGISALVWGVVCFFFGLSGAFLTSSLVWGVVCAFLGFIGALLLLIAERNALIAEKNALIAEKNALIAEKNALIAERNTKRQATASNSSGAPSDPVAATPWPQQQSARPQRQWGFVSSRPSAPQPIAPPGPGVGGGDLLPRR